MMLHPLNLAACRKQLVGMTAPTCRVVALPVTPNRSPIEDRLDPSPQPIEGHRFCRMSFFCSRCALRASIRRSRRNASCGTRLHVCVRRRGDRQLEREMPSQPEKIVFFQVGGNLRATGSPGVLPAQLVYLPVTRPGVELPVFARHEYRTWELDKWAVRSAARRWS
jgi:hypothetical protein